MSDSVYKKKSSCIKIVNEVEKKLTKMLEARKTGALDDFSSWNVVSSSNSVN